jgi:ATP-dependent helicase HrpA
VPNTDTSFTLPDACLSRDRHILTQEGRRLRERQQAGKPADRLEKQWRERLEVSQAAYARRLASLPRPIYDEDLPVNQRREEIAAAISGNPVVIVCGETGSGKTTQLPKLCLDLRRGVAGMIGHTQPRRVAARSIANRVASELNSPLGHAVGYKVRFQDKLSELTYIKLMTDGILLAETQGDPLLLAYDTIIIDEAHERSLNIDFLLGYLKRLLPRRPDLKVIITSATIDAERFSRHFDGAPVVEVSGRLYPVEVRYRPLEAKDEDDREIDMEQAIVDAVDEVSRLGLGDVLVFLPGEREIRDTAELLRKHHPPGTEILPLFARQSASEQERVFQPSGRRRIVLATNVAETSLTVPGIRYVIDPGLARINRYSYRNKVQQLQVEKISQAAANQRSGRCGRVMSGVCVRLYGEAEFTARPPFTDPEILRTSLAAVILRMASLRLGDVDAFPFLEPPAPKAVADGYQLLGELGAVTEERTLTPLGEQLAKLPIDPKVGRMLLAAKEENCLTEVLVIASALSVPDPRMRPMERAGAADNAHRHFSDERSDFLAYLKLWTFYQEAVEHKKSNRKLINLCHDHFLSYVRMREWIDIHHQLQAVVTEMGFRPNETPAGYDEIHRALLAGLLGNVGVKTEEEGVYAGARGIKFAAHPSSVFKKKGPKWVMAAELVETTKLFARGMARIEPEWLEKVGPHLVKRHYFDPHWEKAGARVAGYERVTLYGLTLIPRRKIHYGPLNPKEARDIFIRQALVEGNYDSRAPFFEHNRQLVEDVQELEHKSRRQDVLVDEERMVAFYDARIPADMHNGAAFERWRRDAEKDNPKLLFMSRDDLMRHDAEGITETLFPKTLAVGEVACPLTYRFEPGHPLDGVTLTVPLHLLNKVDEVRCAWLVPGMVREKVTALVKGLPKQLRRLCVPVPEFVTGFLDSRFPSPLAPLPPAGEGNGALNSPPPQAGEALHKGLGERGSLAAALTAHIKRRTGQDVPTDAWEGTELPEHLKMHYRVVDDAGQELASDRDLAELRGKLGQAAQMTFAKGPDSDFEREGVTAWDFGDLPEKLAFSRGGAPLTGFPALADRGDSVAILLLDTPEAAAREMRGGVRRLLRLSLKEQMKQLEKSLPNFTHMALLARTIENPDEFREDLLTCIADRAFLGDDEPPRSEKAFQNQRDRARTRLPAVTEAAAKLAAAVLDDHHALQAKLAGKLPYPLAQDLKEQLGRLVYKGFLAATPWPHLQHLPRYLEAMLKRIEKYPGNADRDAKHTASLKDWWDKLETRREKHRKAGIDAPKLEDFRWMLEELRVSLFAQELRTPYPISYKRLEKAWGEIRP